MRTDTYRPRGWLGAVDGVLGVISKTLTVLAALLMVLIALLISADVFGRGLFSKPIIGVAELVVNTLVIIAFLQLPFTVRIGGMLRTEIMDMVPNELFKRSLWLTGHLLGAFFFAVLAWAEWGNMVTSFINNEFEGHVTFAVPVFPSRLAIVVGSGLASVAYLVLAALMLGGMFASRSSPAKPSEVQHG